MLLLGCSLYIVISEKRYMKMEDVDVIPTSQPNNGPSQPLPTLNDTKTDNHLNPVKENSELHADNDIRFRGRCRHPTPDGREELSEGKHCVLLLCAIIHYLEHVFYS
jgi:hypothetical protein